MSKKKVFEVTLTPLEPYFFGGEKTFYKDPYSEGGQEYYVRSNLFPQQTALLGAMRYVLLEQNGLLPLNNSNKADAEQLIGPSSFDMGQSAAQSFGVIERLSPIFFKYNHSWLRASEKSKGYTLSPVSNSRSILSMPGATEKDTLLLSGYNAKEGKTESWTDANGNTQQNETLYTETERVGIQKQRDESDEEAFYKQVFIQLKNDCCFVFHIELKENGSYVFGHPQQGRKEVKFAKAVITVGAERSPFRMQVTEISDFNYQSMFSVFDTADAPKLVLLSDTIVKPAALNACRFVLADTVDFRQLRTSVAATTNYASRRKFNTGEKGTLAIAERSDKYKLLKKGGVLYFKTNDDLNAFATNLTEHSAYQIGYNHFQTIQKN